MDFLVGYIEVIKMKGCKGQQGFGSLLMRNISNKGNNLVVYDNLRWKVMNRGLTNHVSKY